MERDIKRGLYFALTNMQFFMNLATEGTPPPLTREGTTSAIVFKKMPDNYINI